MTTRTLARRAALAGATLTAALALTACGGDGHSSPEMGHGTPGTGGPSATATGAAAFGDADAMFAQMMIPHHQQAVEMADLAATRAADPEVKRLAAEIKAAQAPEIATMSGWLTAWGRPVPSPGAEMPHMDHGMPGMMSDADMTKLAAASGREFDRQFLTMMIAHHEGAVTMARDEIAKGVNAEAKALAGQIVSSQQAEIDTMRKILGRF
ncbi:DUF305 domain-containing protein [Micromonospora peucetia]|uniref:Uncharacterized conserved protein, DUF305 family n=1 Tax=Micromonospora peucetia TaxID=47871 RepID=A0A1C6UM19_9ACTN|nr:DUF305 domain-containing protein [Micromonospora peucetia]MCX4387017.1 DUF305 domain-containing protein [Micromonospora peucetia]SCL55070.1 Uncharacterized conserved protein, DUF305 family [Micromonospora peucetia]